MVAVFVLLSVSWLEIIVPLWLRTNHIHIHSLCILDNALSKLLKRAHFLTLTNN